MRRRCRARGQVCCRRVGVASCSSCLPAPFLRAGGVPSSISRSAELLALSLWFSASAVLPTLAREWRLGDAGAAALTIAVQLGFIVGTLASALGNLPDVWSARSLMVASCALGARRQCRRRALGGQSRAGPDPAIRHRHRHGGRLPAGDEDHGDMVSRGPRPRPRHPDRRPHRGLGGAASDPRPHRPAVAARLARAPRSWRSPAARSSGPSSGRARTGSPRRASTCAWRARSSAIAALAWPASAISATCGSCTPCGRGSARSSRRAWRRAAEAPTSGSMPAPPRSWSSPSARSGAGSGAGPPIDGAAPR